MVHSPVAGYTGKVGRVAFAAGRAVVDAGASELDYFRRRGYHVKPLPGGAEDVPVEAEQVDTDDSVDTDVADPVEEADAEQADDGEEDSPADALGMPHGNASRGTWADFAEAQGIDTEGLTKAKIIEAVKAALGAQ